MSDISNIVMLQTCDPKHYLPMLRATARVNQVYCSRHGIAYSQYIGIKRGYHPWQACFNRIPLIKEMIDTGYRGWVFYLDADAFVFDLERDPRDFIAGRGKSILISPGGVPIANWKVNDGVFLANLGDEIVRDLMLRWHTDFMTTPDHALEEEPLWWANGGNILGDQARLQRLLRESRRYQAAVAMVPSEVFNHDKGSFVRQILRAHVENFEDRLARIQEETDHILALHETK